MFVWFLLTVDFDSCSTYIIHELNEDKSYRISWQGDIISTSDCKIGFNPYNSNSPLNKYQVCIRASNWDIQNTEVKLKYYSIFDVLEKVSNIYLTMLVVIGTDCTGNCKSNYHTITATTAL